MMASSPTFRVSNLVGERQNFWFSKQEESKHPVLQATEEFTKCKIRIHSLFFNDASYEFLSIVSYGWIQSLQGTFISLGAIVHTPSTLLVATALVWCSVARKSVFLE